MRCAAIYLVYVQHMKTLTHVLFLSLLLLTQGKTMASEDEIYDKGFFNTTELLEQKYYLFRQLPEQNYLAKYIVKANYMIKSSEAQELAGSIIRIASCFHVDPWILAALIQKESSFVKDATSPTNAAGLTQFTTRGLKEVNDQLGLNGRVGTYVTNIAYFRDRILSCVNPNWVDLWDMVPTTQADETFFKDLKEVLKQDADMAITYGAVLLKTYTVSIEQAALKENLPLSMSEKYFLGLQRYNGEPGEKKIDYANQIFDIVEKMYPTPVKFSFSSRVMLGLQDTTSTTTK